MFNISLVVLKLVGTPHAMLVERFQIMWPDGGGPDLQVRRGWRLHAFSDLVMAPTLFVSIGRDFARFCDLGFRLHELI